MSASKILIGTAIVAGGAFYYDQNVQPIFPRRDRVQADLDKLDHKQQKISNRFSSRLDDTKKKVEKQPSITDQIKDTSLYQNFSRNESDVKEKAQQQLDTDKNVFIRGIDKYIDFINELGGGSKKSDVEQKATEEKNSWSNWFQKKDADARDQLRDQKEKARETGDSWFGWGSKKAEEVKKDFKENKKEWSSWGSKKQNEAENEAASAKDDWFGWKSKKQDEAQKSAEGAKNVWEARANEVQDSAKNAYDSAKDTANKHASSLESQWDATRNDLTARYNQGKQTAIESYEAAKARLDELTSSKAPEPNREERLDRAKADFNSSLSNLKAYGDDVVDSVNDKLKSTFGRK